MKATRRGLLAAGVAAMAGAAARPGHAQTQTQAAPARLPRMITWPAEVTLLDGRRLDAAMLKARPVVAVFWSTTCPFCRNHNRHVEKLQRISSGSDLLVLGVSIDRDMDAIVDHVRHEGYTFAVTADAGKLGPVFDARHVIPRTYAVERGGRLVAAIPGEMFEEDVLELMRITQPG